jgi:hypothetical protein
MHGLTPARVHDISPLTVYGVQYIGTLLWRTECTKPTIEKNFASSKYRPIKTSPRLTTISWQAIYTKRLTTRNSEALCIKALHTQALYIEALRTEALYDALYDALHNTLHDVLHDTLHGALY